MAVSVKLLNFILMIFHSDKTAQILCSQNMHWIVFISRKNERQIKDTQKQADSLKHHFEERNINFLNYNQRVE
jgi:hypothetical protein